MLEISGKMLRRGFEKLAGKVNVKLTQRQDGRKIDDDDRRQV
jgi:hypothetical protein